MGWVSMDGCAVRVAVVFSPAVLCGKSENSLLLHQVSTLSMFMCQYLIFILRKNKYDCESVKNWYMKKTANLREF